jgi:DHA1 family tetracycline resistance protein-like MFS transporter
LNKKLLFSIFLIVFIDLLGFSLILPLLPFYAETFGASPITIGLLVAIYAAMQFIGAPILGRLSDRYGRRPMLIASIFGTFLSFLLMGITHSLAVLFIARGLDGLTGGNISIAQAYISDVTDAKNRSRGMGIIGAAFGLGFIFGPALGGLLSRWGYSLPVFIAAGMALINLILIIFWLPESLTPERRSVLASDERPSLTPGALWQALRRPKVGPLLHSRFFFGLVFSAFQSIFTLYAQYRFNLDSQHIGYILAYVGILSALTQGVILGRLSNRFSEYQLLVGTSAVLAISLLGWAFAPTIGILLAVLAPISITSGVLNTSINSAISKSVSPAEIGGTLGLSAALESMTRVIAPSLAGVLLEKLGTSAPGIFSAVLMVGLTTYVWRYLWHDRSSLAQVSEKMPIAENE